MIELSRILPYMNIEKRCILLKTFFISQFNNFPYKNNKINRLQEIYLMIITTAKYLLLHSYWKR